ESELRHVVAPGLIARLHAVELAVVLPDERGGGHDVALRGPEAVEPEVVHVPAEHGLGPIPADEAEQPGSPRLGEIVVALALLKVADERRIVDGEERALSRVCRQVPLEPRPLLAFPGETTVDYLSVDDHPVPVPK